jgi:hypothetical protein
MTAGVQPAGDKTGPIAFGPKDIARRRAKKMLATRGPQREAARMCPSSLEAQLAHFHGSATRARHAVVPSVLMTEGVVFLAQAAGAHWLTDVVASYIRDARASQEEFQVWRLMVDAINRTGVITIADGDCDAAIVTQLLDYTDFSLVEITVWLVREGARWITLLPSD